VTGVDGEAADDPSQTQAHEVRPEPADAATGNAAVDDATRLLDRLDELPTAEHVEVFEDVHRRLEDALTDLDGG
jgi:hypothetical protein